MNEPPQLPCDLPGVPEHSSRSPPLAQTNVLRQNCVPGGGRLDWVLASITNTYIHIHIYIYIHMYIHAYKIYISYELTRDCY